MMFWKLIWFAETTQFDENHDKLANAAENWHQASSKTIDGLTVKELSGNFNLAHGSFDPLFRISTIHPRFIQE